MYLPRQLSDAFQRALRALPAVFVTGPRQSGKTTFVRHELAGSADYVSLDDPVERALAREDPIGFVDRFTGSAIIDEIQVVPELLSVIKLRVDERRSPGRFVLTGSQQYALMAGITESLAGRVAILELLPFAASEVNRPRDLANHLWCGFYPALAVEPDHREFWLPGYIRTYLERDVRQMRQIADLGAFEHFVALAAAAHGQEWNAARLARSIGVSKPTIKAWLGVLEAGYIGFRVPPYFRNLGKRLVRSPKWYFLDPALVCALTRQPSAEAAAAGAMAGPLFEGLVVAEALKVRTNAGRRPECYHWRSHDGLEVDLIVRTADGLVPVEIKKTSTPTPRHAAALTRFVALEPEAAPRGLVVCTTDVDRTLPNGHRAIPWQSFAPWLAAAA